MDTCTVEGCTAAVSRKGHTLCKPHWTAQKAGSLGACPTCKALLESSSSGCPRCAGRSVPIADEAGDEGSQVLSSRRLGTVFGVNAQRMNLVLAELGWIEKYTKGWKPTPQGRSLGGTTREMRQKGVPYVVWPQGIAANHALVTFMRELEGEGAEPAKADGAPVAAARAPTRGATSAADFRARFPATMRSADGHMVRSRGEVLIDNFLYVQGIVHAYERRLPVQEDVLCDFYLPRGNVYIEYWGLEKSADYAERKAEKKAVYEKHGMKLIELNNDHIAALDDELPRMLLKFGIDCT